MATSTTLVCWHAHRAGVDVLKNAIADLRAQHRVVINRVILLDQEGDSSSSTVHVNVSPGTPAMHAVWLTLYAAGALQPGTRLWSSQKVPGEPTRIDEVDFPLSTYLGEIRRARAAAPTIAQYELEPRSNARRAAFEHLALYARLHGAPLLILGERGTGKSRLVESVVGSSSRGR